MAHTVLIVEDDEGIRTYLQNALVRDFNIIEAEGGYNGLSEVIVGERDIDLIITGRGGGSLEDLWPFNTEVVVRAIVKSRLPVISAVGHEIDTTLSDLSSDLRAPTPSAAAELAVWSKSDFVEVLESSLLAQASSLKAMVAQARANLGSMLSRPVFVRPVDIVGQRTQYLDHLSRVLVASGKNRFDRFNNALSLALARLETLSPLKILARGYSVTRTAENGTVIKSSNQVSKGQRIESILADSYLLSIVEQTGRRK